MTEVSGLTRERVEKELEALLASGRLEGRMEQLVSLRFGIGSDKPLTVQEIARVLKRSPKRVKQELETAERRVFNLLKDQL